jgi:Tfp pilus assembly protein PilV
MSVIEVVLAIVVLIIVLLPASILINNAILASNDQRLKVEADNLATANLEKVQQEAQSGPLSGGTTSFTYQSRSGSQ